MLGMALARYNEVLTLFRISNSECCYVLLYIAWCPYEATKIVTFTERLIPSKQENVYRYNVLVPSSLICIQ